MCHARLNLQWNLHFSLFALTIPFPISLILQCARETLLWTREFKSRIARDKLISLSAATVTKDIPSSRPFSVTEPVRIERKASGKGEKKKLGRGRRRGKDGNSRVGSRAQLVAPREMHAVMRHEPPDSRALPVRRIISSHVTSLSRQHKRRRQFFSRH